MKTLISFVVVAALATPAFALPVIEETHSDNGNGSTTYSFTIESLQEISFLELTIMGSLHQVRGNGVYVEYGPPWAPNLVFTSDVDLFLGLNPLFDPTPSFFQNTVINDEYWLGKVVVDLTPNDGNELDGTQMVNVALASFTGPGQGGPLPGGPIPLAQVTIWNNTDLWLSGKLQSDSDNDGSFEWHNNIPEPSTFALAGFGLMGLVAGVRRRS